MHVGHDRDQVTVVDAVTDSTAIPNDEHRARRSDRDGIPVLRRAAMLAAICAQATLIAVAGTHGKTTTTSMLTLILAEAGCDPTFVIGGDVHDIGTGRALDRQ